MKLIFLRLVKIRYEGESIGDDITIDVQAGDTFFTLNKRLNSGSEARIDKTVATFTASVDPWVIPISVTITERDPIFNDSATQAERFSLSLAAAPPSTFNLGLEVKENPAGRAPTVGVFALEFAAEIAEALSTEDGTRTYAAISSATPIAPALYDLEIPDAPHRGGVLYPEAPHARVWFRIGHKGDRYLHTGTRSAGCVTVLETARWEELYALLIAARKGDGVSVGTLHVVE